MACERTKLYLVKYTLADYTNVIKDTEFRDELLGRSHPAQVTWLHDDTGASHYAVRLFCDEEPALVLAMKYKTDMMIAELLNNENLS